MSEKVRFTIDGKECTAGKGKLLVEAAAENGIFIPTLCYLKDVKPAGSCRLCNVLINGRPATACTTPVADGMVIENNIPQLTEMRKIILETLFVSGNHFCPACEKSGNCQLQALAYRYRIMIPRFQYDFPEKEVDATTRHFYLERNRCILCKRCVRSIKTKDGKSIFAMKGRGHKAYISIDHELADRMTEEEALKAMETCPVGCIIKKERGFIDPIGKRKYDTEPIGSDIEKLVNTK